MTPHFKEFFTTYHYGPVNGYAHFHADPNAMSRDLIPSGKNRLVKVLYTILSVNTHDYLYSAVRRQNDEDAKADLPVVGQTFSAEYNPVSGFILPQQGISWGFGLVHEEQEIEACRARISGNAMKRTRTSQIGTIKSMYERLDEGMDREYLDKCLALAENIDLYADNIGEYVYIYIPDDRKGYMPYRLCGKVTERNEKELKVLILSHMGTSVFGIECLIDRKSDACHVETILRYQDFIEYKGCAENFEGLQNWNTMSVRELSEHINRGRRSCE